MQERNQEALAEVQSLITMYPQMPDTYWFLGLAHIASQDEASALNAIDQAVDYGYNFQNINDLKLAISLLSQKTDLPRLEEAYSQAIVLEPRNLQWYASLATVYSQLGQKDKAIETANKIIDIDPDSRPDVEQFIKGL
jgi:tetratricopeptide (TPR) repeat protein